MIKKAILILLFFISLILNGQSTTSIGRYTDANAINAIETNKLDSLNTENLVWSGGDVVYLPLTGDIQSYIDNLDAGSTLVLASGVYTITDTIEIDKEINIRGQGSSGFVTSPITPSHGTLITSSTDNLMAFKIKNDNIRISDLSINLSGAASTGISIDNNLNGIALNNIDVIVNCSGDARGFIIKGTNIVMRDLQFYIISSDATAVGVLYWNDNTTTQDAILDAFSVTGTVQGGNTYAHAFSAYNINDDNVLTMNFANSEIKALAGTDQDVGIMSMSAITNNVVVNAFMCTVEGEDYDAYQMGANELNLGGTVVVNNKVYGTPTYRAAMTANTMVSETTTMTDLSVYADNAAALVGGLTAGQVYRTATGDLKIVYTP